MKNSQKTGGLIAMIAAALFIDFTVYLVLILVGDPS